MKKIVLSSAKSSWPDQKILATFAALGFAGWAGSNLLDIFLQERKVKRAQRRV
ncbi:hypothetical protein [Brevibacillus laterosporus]|uniref:hypothetical protein n=1 Tax=Brevibacillus laterosporus TaxID=1465 RepID=UPI0015E25806|nr:hypothetical protein [Brevibacillus laterosporus]